MCYKITCANCGKPSWMGCGKHIETALKGVSLEDRCNCPREKVRALGPNEKFQPPSVPKKEEQSSMEDDANVYDNDVICIGGGSAGLSFCKEASDLGAKVVCFDFVKPSTKNTQWGLGGTCVNVGCIPKKLFHRAAIIRESLSESEFYGMKVKIPDLDWGKLVQNVQDHIHSLNFGHRTQLRQKKVEYINAYASFVDPHTVEYELNGEKHTKKAKYIVIATGCRPFLPNVPGAGEFGITSDDIFSIPEAPGKTLVIGASYIGLECAGYIQGLGFDVTVMVRSRPLRNFDEDMGTKIKEFMELKGTKFILGAEPSKIEKNDKGKLVIHYGDNHEEFDTILFSTGRRPLNDINIEKTGVKFHHSGKILVNEKDRTNVPHIYAIGDVQFGHPELTPVAIKAGRNLALRLFKNSDVLTEYDNVATTVFTPLEYGSCGLSEEQAIEKYGADNVNVYHTSFSPLEWQLPHSDGECYIKLICNAGEDDKVVGYHIVAPNAGEVTQGYAVAMKLNATKKDFDRTIGIHPTVSEEFTDLTKNKRSDPTATKSSC